MKYLFVFSFLLLAACATPSVGFDVKEIKTNEFLGAGYEHLEGKIFSIFCGGNGYANYEYVQASCMRNTAAFVDGKGYKYFTMLSKNGDTDKTPSGYVSNGVYVPTTIIKHSQSYIIFLLEQNQIKKANNYYKVSDYYVPESQIKSD